MFRLSQNQLKILEECSRKFQHGYLELLASTTSPEQQEKLTWGSQFHLLMQQREIGLPIEFIIQQDPEMGRCVAALIDTAPELFVTDLETSNRTFRQAEHPRTLIFQDYLFTAIYDLLIAEPNTAQIIDWKTYPRPQKSERICHSWQTRLYLYLLVETSDYSPEQISMTYWFVQLQGEEAPQKLTFTYDRAQHDRTKQDLTNILNKLTLWRQQYADRGEFFPQVDISSHQCDSCQFATRCDRIPSTKKNSALEVPVNWMPNLAIIEEISI